MMRWKVWVWWVMISRFLHLVLWLYSKVSAQKTLLSHRIDWCQNGDGNTGYWLWLTASMGAFVHQRWPEVSPLLLAGISFKPSRALAAKMSLFFTEHSPMEICLCKHPVAWIPSWRIALHPGLPVCHFLCWKRGVPKPARSCNSLSGGVLEYDHQSWYAEQPKCKEIL